MDKSQFPNPKSQINPKSQYPKFVCLEFGELKFACLPARQGAYLEFGACNLGFMVT